MMQQTVAIFELVENGRLPERKTAGSAAYDVYCPKDFIIRKGRQKIPTGFKMSFDPSIEVLIEARSGFELNGFEGCSLDDPERTPKRFDADVLTGKIDSDYPDEVNVIVKSYSDEPFICMAGTRIAQLTFVRIDHPRMIVGKVEQTTDRCGGFTSTGTR